jgi:hypothetical protein
MKRIVSILFLFTLLIACDNEPEIQQGITYIDLQDVTAGHNKLFSLDIDQDGDTEYVFTTTLAADAAGDQLQFMIYPSRNNQVFEIAGRVGVLSEDQEIAPGNPFDKNVQPMVIKTITDSGINWSGDWKEANNQFVGIRFYLRDKGYHYGWIRVSFDQTNGQFIIHDYAFMTTLNMKIVAGQDALQPL